MVCVSFECLSFASVNYSFSIMTSLHRKLIEKAAGVCYNLTSLIIHSHPISRGSSRLFVEQHSRLGGMVHEARHCRSARLSEKMRSTLIFTTWFVGPFVSCRFGLSAAPRLTATLIWFSQRMNRCRYLESVSVIHLLCSMYYARLKYTLMWI